MYNPLLSIFIEGPNELDVHATIVLDKIVGEFAIYKPVTEALGLIYLLALPWKITLESGDGEELNLGIDKLPFKIIRSNPKTTVIQVTDLLDTQEGDSIRLFFENSKRILPSTVLSIQNNELEISGQFQHNGYLLNYTKQFTIIMETHSILQKK